MTPQALRPIPESLDSAAAVLAAARGRRREADRAEAELLVLAVEWCAMHPPESLDRAATYGVRGVEATLLLAGEGAPQVAEFCVAEFAAAVGLSPEAGRHLLAEAMELRFRLPRMWQRVTAGDLVAWKARRVAAETLRLSPEAARWVDSQVAPVARKVGPAQLERLVNEAIGRFMPAEVERLAALSWDKRHVTVHDQLVSFTATMSVTAELDIADALDLETAVEAGAAALAALGSADPLDVRRARAVGDLARGQLALALGAASHSGGVGEAAAAPRVKPRRAVLYVHLSEAALSSARVDRVARLERGGALVDVEQVRYWCRDPQTEVVVTPVIDLEACVESRADLASQAIVEQVTLRDATCVFPWCTRPARRCTPDEPGCDRDHVVARGRGGPTCSCNIAPLCRRHHRLKTHSPWRYTVVEPGVYLWSSPHGYQFLRDPAGTTDVSHGGTHPPPEAVEAVEAGDRPT